MQPLIEALFSQMHSFEHVVWIILMSVPRRSRQLRPS
jgi:hypothetical protein